jgi:transposase
MCYHVGMSKPSILLSTDMSQQLHDLCKSPVSSVYRKARIILLAAECVPVSIIAHALGISVRSVKSTIQAFKINGTDALTSCGSVGRPSGSTPQQRQAIVDLLKMPPGKFGIDKSFWTAADLAMIAERKQIAQKVSPATVRRIVLDAGIDWHTAKHLHNEKMKMNSNSTIMAESKSTNPMPADDQPSLLAILASACAKNEAEREQLFSIYSALVRRYGNKDRSNYLQIELLATHLLSALKTAASGDKDAIDKILSIVRSHLEELELEAAIRKRRAGPLPGTTPAEIASELLERWQRAQAEDRETD